MKVDMSGAFGTVIDVNNHLTAQETIVCIAEDPLNTFIHAKIELEIQLEICNITYSATNKIGSQTSALGGKIMQNKRCTG